VESGELLLRVNNIGRHIIRFDYLSTNPSFEATTGPSCHWTRNFLTGKRLILEGKEDTAKLKMNLFRLLGKLSMEDEFKKLCMYTDPESRRFLPFGLHPYSPP
jgi:hypothetical protein